jgi:hypothetical protein
MAKKKIADEPCIEYVNLGPWPNFVGFTTSSEAFAAELARLAIPEQPFLARDSANATTYHFSKGRTNVIIVCIVPPRLQISPEQYAALIAHEALHVIQYIREDINQGECLGREAEAYLMQHFVQEFLQMAKYRNRQRQIYPRGMK